MSYEGWNTNHVAQVGERHFLEKKEHVQRPRYMKLHHVLQKKIMLWYLCSLKFSRMGVVGSGR